MLFTLKILSSLSFPNITLIPLIYHSPHTYYFSLLLYITLLLLTTHPSHPSPFFSHIPNPTHTHLLSLITYHTHLSSLIILISHHSSPITHHPSHSSLSSLISIITHLSYPSHPSYHLSITPFITPFTLLSSIPLTLIPYHSP
jgi:hypothetical protein